MRSSLRIAVLMGGPSGEHEVSLKSGEGVARALAGRGWTVEPVVIPKAVSVEQACGVVRQAFARLRPEVAFLALHGPFGEDGTIQQVCEECRIAYTGSDAAASRLGMDKLASRHRFIEAGLAVPAWQLVDLDATWQDPDLSYPLVVKPVSQGSSLGVSIVREPAELPAALAGAGQYGSRILVEAFVPGRELTVGILVEEPLPVIEIRSRHAFFDFSAKYTKGLTEYLVPAELPPAIAQAAQAAALTAHRSLGCRHLSRADLILRPDGVPVVLEVNTIPGFTPTSLLPKAAACIGLSYEALCEQVAMMACLPRANVLWRGRTASPLAGSAP